MKTFYILLSLFLIIPIMRVSGQSSDSPNIAYVYPAGIQRGKTAKFIVGGRGFKDVRAIVVTGGGVSAKMGEITIPEGRNSKNALINKLEKKYLEANPDLRAEVEKQGVNGQKYLRDIIRKDPENLKKFAEIDESYYLRLVSSDALAETVEFELKADSDAAVGERRIFLVGAFGVSNPVVFMVGTLPEFSKKSLRTTARERIAAEKNKSRMIWTFNDTSFVVPSKREVMDIEIPVVANGQIVEAKTDCWRFFAKKGQKIVAAVAVRQLIPYISDAVPGWFQPVVRITDENGNELDYNDDFEHRPDSYICFEAPADGNYILQINDAIYRSREDFVYRLTMGEIPFIRSVFPFVVSDFGETEVTLEGDNLKENTLKISRARSGIFNFENENFFHNRIPMAATSAKSELSNAERAFKNGADASMVAPQKISSPACVDGIIRRAAQTDVFKIFLADKEKILFETFARRLDSPLDSYLTVSDSDGKVLASSDDFEDPSCAYVTHHADSKILFEAPYTGDFYVRVSDTSGKHSPSHAYRLFAGRSNPDFELRSERSCVNLGAGGTDSFVVKIYRKNGFGGTVKIRAEGLPDGWILGGAEIPAGSDSAEITVTAPAKVDREIFYPEFFGEYEEGAAKVSRKMIPCDNMMQAFYYWHAVPSNAFRVYVRKAQRFGQFKSLSLSAPEAEGTIKIPADKIIEVKIGDTKSNKGIWMLVPEISSVAGSVEPLKVFERKGALMLQLRAKNGSAKIGDKGRMIISLFVKRGGNRFLLGKVPSLEYEIVEKLVELPKVQAAAPVADSPSKPSVDAPSAIVNISSADLAKKSSTEAKDESASAKKSEKKKDKKKAAKKRQKKSADKEDSQ